MRQSRHLGLNGLHTYDTNWIEVELRRTYRISGARFGDLEDPYGGTRVTRGGEMMTGQVIGDIQTIRGTGLFGIGNERDENNQIVFSNVGNITAVPVFVPYFNGQIIGVDFRYYQTELNIGSFDYCWSLSACPTEYPSLTHTYLPDLHTGVVGTMTQDPQLIAQGSFHMDNDINGWWATKKKNNSDNLLTGNLNNSFADLKYKRKTISNTNTILYLYFWSKERKEGNIHIGSNNSGPAFSVRFYYKAYHKIEGWTSINIGLG